MEFHNTGILGKKAPGVKEDKIAALIVLFLATGYFVTIMRRADFRLEHTKDHNSAKITKPMHKCTSEIKALQKKLFEIKGE